MLDKNSTMVKYGVSLLVGFFSFFFLFYLSAILLESRLPESIKLEDGWEVAVNGTSYTKPLLSDVHFPIVSTGDVVTLTRSLSNYPIPNPVLRVHAWYSIVDISLNGLQVYSYGHEIAAEGKNVGCGFHVIPISNLPDPSVLRITLIVCEPNSFSTILPVYVESAENTFPGIVRGNLLLCFASLFFITWGVIGLIGSVIMVFCRRSVKVPLVCCFFLLCLGLESLYHNGVVDAFFRNFSFNSWMEHISIFFLNISFMLMFITLMPLHRHSRRSFYILLGWFCLYVFGAVVLDFVNVIHLPATRVVLFASIGAELLCGTIAIIESMLHHKFEENLNSIGFIAVVIAVIGELLIYYILKNVNAQVNVLTGTGIIVGTVLMFLSIMMGLLLKVRPRAEHDTSEKLYNISLKTDYLSGLPNQIAFEESLQDFEERYKEAYYAIILNIEPLGTDVPGLDTFEGNSVLLTFIGFIKNIFGKTGRVFRMADESVCVLYAAENDEIVRKNLNKLDNMLDEENQRHPRMRYCMTAGFSRRSGTTRMNTLYQLAQSHVSKSFK
ncbi:MAG: hypothetical protein MJ196_12630 [Treponemataceae bacterium]|nr:hypothetical protein [Treponemataceae bacterium]